MAFIAIPTTNFNQLEGTIAIGQIPNGLITLAKLATAVQNTLLAVVPIGGIVGWHKAFANTPALPNRFVECNGQVLSDAESVYDGQTIPDLNGNVTTIIGNATSGTAGNQAHTHTNSGSTSSVGASAGDGASGIHSHTFDVTTGSTDTGNTFTMVWVMRVK